MNRAGVAVVRIRGDGADDVPDAGQDVDARPNCVAALMQPVVEGAEHAVGQPVDGARVTAGGPESELDVVVGGCCVPCPVVVVAVEEDRRVWFVGELSEEDRGEAFADVDSVRCVACESEVGEVLGEGFEEFDGVRCPNECHPSCLRIDSARICPTTSLVAMTAFSRYFASPS